MTGPHSSWGPVSGPPWHFPMVLGCLVYLLLIHIHFSSVCLFHISYINLKAESFCSCYSQGDIITGNPLPTIPSHMSHSATIKTFGILVSSLNIGNRFFYTYFSTIVKCLNIHLYKTHSSMVAALIFKGQRIYLNSMLAFS